MKKTSTCFSMTCGNVVDGDSARCPKCGSKMRSSKAVRILGGLMIVCGIVLIGLMGVVTWHVGPQMLRPGEMIDGGTWTGTAEQGRMALTLFGLVFAFGSVALLNGIWQVSTGRRNRVFLLLTLVLAAGLVAAVYYTNSILPS